MPYDLFSFYKSGANAMAAPEISRAAEQEAKLQQIYRPQAMAAQAEAQQLQLQQLRDTVKGNAEAQKWMSEHPNTSPADSLDALSRVVSDPKLRVQYAKDAADIREKEARAEKEKYAAEDSKVEHFQRTLDNLDPSDPASIQKGILAVTQAGGDPTRFINEVRTLGPEQAIKNAEERLTSFRQRREDARQKEALAKANRESEKIDQGWARIDASNRRLEAMLSRGDKVESRKDQQRATNLSSSMNKDYSRLREKYEKAYAEAKKAQNKATTAEDKNKAVEAMNDANDMYYSDIQSLNDRYEQRFTDLGIEFKPYEPVGGGKRPTETTTTKTTSQEDFNTKWGSLKSGEKLIGPDGKTYTKK